MYERFLIKIQSQPIDCDAILKNVASPVCGAAVLFTGSPRQFTGLSGSQIRETAWLEYECYEEMARTELGHLCLEASKKFECHSMAIVHRMGRVMPGDVSIAIAVSSPHRAAAFETAQWLMDGVKTRVPVWKREHLPDGSAHWVSGSHLNQGVEKLVTGSRQNEN